MKRCLLTLIAGLLCSVASAQAVFRLQYWFDNQHDNRITDTFSTSRWQPLLEASQLSSGLHTLSLQVQDSTGEWFSPSSYLFYRIPNTDTLDYVSYRYWFDDDFEHVQSDSTPTGNLLLDAGILTTGLHTITFQFNLQNSSIFKRYLFYKSPFPENDSMEYVFWFDQDYNNRQSGHFMNDNLLLDVESLCFGVHTLNAQFTSGNRITYKSYLFYRSPLPENDSMEYVFWFDQNYDNRQSGHFMNDHLMLDVESLCIGVHTLNAQFTSGNRTTYKSYLFYKSPMPDTDSMEYVFWFDQNYDNRQSGHFMNNHLLFDVDSLCVGVHTLNAQFNSGNKATLKSYLFYKTPAIPNENESIEYIFWIDQDYDNRQSGQILNGNLVFDVDSLSAGIHALNAQFGTSDDAKLKSFLFYKKPHAEIMIVRYEYWLNELDSLKQSFSISPQDTVDLVSLLTVPSLPIRSSYFHFNPNDGNPIINAKNDIHFRFYNGEGRYTEKTKTYVDITVVDTVYADTIERNTTKIVAAPTNNAIHWFKLGAGVGDSLSFKTDKLCTMQLYSPSGEMVFHASNDSVLSWDGCHAWEQGDYYLAVHDATDTGTIAVSYQWIYRYAVLAWDVHRVGNGGVSTITFEGNGFSSLDTMFLVRGTDTIPTLYIERVSNTTMSVFFNFESVDTGMYNGMFIYTDENLYKTDVVYVEEAKPIVLTTTCSFPSAFLRGSTVTYTYTITNTGNMTAYAVPIFIYIGSNSRDGISKIKLEGLSLSSLSESFDFDSLSQSDIEQIKKWESETGDGRYFYEFSNNDNDSLDNHVWSNYFFINVNAYESKEISIQLTATGYVNVWVSVPDNIPNLTVPNNKNSYLRQNYASSKSFSDWYCCAKEKIECIVNIAANTLDLAALFMDAAAAAAAVTGVGAPVTLALLEAATIVGNTSCVLSTGSTLFPIINGIFCEEEEGNFLNQLSNLLNSNIKSMIGALFSCINIAGVNKNTLRAGMGFIEQAFRSGLKAACDAVPVTITDEWNCIKEWKKPNPDCPPVPPSGGKSDPRISMDPNEITGYIAESGSLAVSAEQVQMPFMIEFENDTTFATAHAHTVVVKDTLDGNVFELNSLSATSFGIGENLEMINGEQNFIRTMDMRPAIDVLAQVQLNYHIDTSFAVATWTFSSLDPMTLQPTTDPTLGFLPANFNGDGVGEVHFTINRKTNLPDSTLIRNCAWITFDNEDPIPTSVWTNIVDVTPPESQLITFTDSTGEQKMGIVATDNLSGVWRYNLYGQQGDVDLLLNAYIPADSAITVDTTLVYDSYYSLAVDSAGNLEALHSQIPHYTLAAIVADSTMGAIAGSGTYTEGDTALLTVHANCGFHFLRWADNVTDNPRQVVVWSDTTLMAIFEADSNVVLFETYCDSYTWQNGMTYTTSGTYYDTLTNASGCDSVVTLHLTINYSNTGDTTVVVCNSFDWYEHTNLTQSGDYTHTFTNAAGCDSVVTLHLTINYSNTGDTNAIACDSFDWCEYTNLTQSGDYTHTFTNAAGCDSVVTLHLTVNYSNTGDTTAVACNSFDWYEYTNLTQSGDYTHTFTNEAGCDSVVTLHLTVNYSNIGDTTAIACDFFDWYEYTNLTQSGDYTHTFTNAAGCDSVVTLHLTVLYSNIGDTTAIVCNFFDWYEHTNLTQSGEYAHTFTNAAGCDSVVTLHLTISYSNTGDTNAVACDSFDWYEYTNLAQSGNYTRTVTNAAGCDSVVTLHLTVNYSNTGDTTVVVCNSFDWYEHTNLTQSGEYTHTFTNAAGCDSVVTLHFTVNYSNTGDTNAIACDFFDWYEHTNLTQSGEYAHTFTNEAGCDSVVTLHLTVVYSNTGDTTAIACDFFDWYEHTNLTQSGDYAHSFTNEAGCDSVVTLHLTVVYSNTGDTTAIACDFFDWYEYTNLTQSGDYTHTFTNEAGCDSVVTLHLTVVYSNIGDTNAVACDSFDWYELTNLTQSGDYTRTITNAAGCDSVVTLHLTVNYSNIGDTTAIACDFFDWYEHTNLTQSGEYAHTFTNEAGCDSVVTLHLTVNYSNIGDTTAIACDFFDWYEYTNLTQSGDYTHTFTNEAGCDSVVTLHLTVNYSNIGDTTAIACDFFDWYEHTNLTQSGDYAHTFTNAAGCDSVVTLHLTINSPVASTILATACDSYEWNGETYTTSGDYEQTFTAANGCDSVVTLHLTVNPSVTEVVEVSTEDSCYTWNSIPYCTSGTYTQTLQTIHGCDSVVTLYLTVSVGIDDLEGFDFMVYPNPTTGIVNVQCTMNNVQEGTMEFHVFDAFGRLLRTTDGVETLRATSLQTDTNGNSTQTAQINLSGFAAGVYFIKAVADGNVVAVRKVVKR